MTSAPCSLCTHQVPQNPILDDSYSFCCAGCHAVFKILSAKNALTNFKTHPLFLQAVRSGLISNPLIMQELLQKNSSQHLDIKKISIEILDMWCPACADLIRLILLNEKGVVKCVVDYTTDLAVIDFHPQIISQEKIFNLISSCGYQPQRLDAPENRTASRSLYLRFLIAAFCALNIMMFSYPVYASYFDSENIGYGNLFAWLSLIASLPIITYCSWPIYRRFFHTLKWGLMGMETLVTLGIVSSFTLSLYGIYQDNQQIYFDTLSVIVSLVLLGKIIETKAKFSAKDSLLWLTRSLPKRARKRKEDRSQVFVKIGEFAIDDLMVISAGEKVCLDGEVVDGEGACNESIVTGEAIPINKQKQSKVMSGSLLVSGWLLVKVTATSKSSALQKLTEMVENEIGNKVQYERITDYISRWFVPVLLVVSFVVGMILFFLTGSVETSVVRSVSILLIACPCAIGIAAPLAESHMMNAMSRVGAIVKNRGCLKLLGRETIFVFDKTGTVTLGRYSVLNGLDKLTTFQRGVIKGMSMLSLHPLSVALKDSILDAPVLPDHVEILVGKGLRGKIDNTTYYLGSEVFLKENGFKIQPTVIDQTVATQIYFAVEQKVYTLILGDSLRPGISELINELSVRKQLVSGDAESAVSTVARAIGIKDYFWGMNPLQKRDLVDQLRSRGEVVCMVGDGINDALALAGAQIGLSVVSASDISIHASDILLTTENIGVIGKIRQVALKGQRIAYQNVFWAFAYNIVGVPLAVLGYMTPLFAAFAMVMSSLFVLFNSQRLK